jgi:hypothetical protein
MLQGPCHTKSNSEQDLPELGQLKVFSGCNGPYRNLTRKEPETGEEATCASARVVVCIKQHLENGDRIPDQLAIHVVDCGSCKYTKGGCDRDCYRCANELIEDRCTSRFGESCPVGLTVVRVRSTMIPRMDKNHHLPDTTSCPSSRH